MIKRVSQQGFTLPELLAASALLLVLVITGALLLQPKSFAPQDRNAERRLDLVYTLYAVQAYYDANGTLPSGITAKDKAIGSQKDSVNLCADLVPSVLDVMPVDPLLRSLVDAKACNKDKADYTTGYTISASSDGKRLTVSAPLADPTL